MSFLTKLSVPVVLIGAAQAASCPFLAEKDVNLDGLPSWHPPVGYRTTRSEAESFVEKFAAVDFEEVKQDIAAVLTDSKDWWPADYGNYGPLMIRLAWHAAGSYRSSDGRGGADGGRMRFEPERSWPDNTNLDKARRLLRPVKDKYGPGLSWGDLLVLTGNVAVEQMGGPVIGFCGGRIDDTDGFWSQELGPTPEQEALMPCDVQGECKFPLAQDVVNLIYVNPEGPHGVANATLSAMNVRSSFGRMGFNDRETVAIVGGGHAFGRTHGSCPNGPGPNPREQPLNPWPGMCGSGKGADTVTSGFEGPWTSNPVAWDNQYFHLLLNWTWDQTENHGVTQWIVNDPEVPRAIAAHGSGDTEIIMLTADLALVADPTYKELVQEFADDQDALDVAFGEAWYKLMTRDMGPRERCLGMDVPPARPFQAPLPEATRGSFDEDAVRSDLQWIMDLDAGAKALFLRLAWSCASTHRITDYHGGCNGARVRLEPQASWRQNMGLDAAYDLLDGVFGAHDISYADLIVLAGTMVVEMETGRNMPFCSGRVDAVVDGDISKDLKPWINLGSGEATVPQMRDEFLRRGLTSSEAVALVGGLHSLGCGTWCLIDWSDDAQFVGNVFDGINNEYFNLLLADENIMQYDDRNQTYYKGTFNVTWLNIDVMILKDPELRAVAERYKDDTNLLHDEFTSAWTKMMIADRFDGPTGNVCTTDAQPTPAPAQQCGVIGRVISEVDKIAIGDNTIQDACECKFLCAVGGNTAYAYKESNNRCSCYTSHIRINEDSTKSEYVGETN